MKKNSMEHYYSGCLWIMVICIIVSYFLERNDLMILCVAGMVATDMCINSGRLELQRKEKQNET